MVVIATQGISTMRGKKQINSTAHHISRNYRCGRDLCGALGDEFRKLPNFPQDRKEKCDELPPTDADGRRIPYTEDRGQGKGITKPQIKTEAKHEEGCINAHPDRGDSCLGVNDNFGP